MTHFNGYGFQPKRHPEQEVMAMRAMQANPPVSSQTSSVGDREQLQEIGREVRSFDIPAARYARKKMPSERRNGMAICINIVQCIVVLAACVIVVFDVLKGGDK